MLKKSSTNRPAPFVSEASPRGKGIPPQPAQASANSGGKVPAKVVANVEAKPSKSSSTFTAPRQEGSHSPLECGYTKP